MAWAIGLRAVGAGVGAVIAVWGLLPIFSGRFHMGSVAMVVVGALLFMACLYFPQVAELIRRLWQYTMGKIGLIAAAVIFFADSSIFRAPLNSLWTGSAEHFAVNWRELLIFAAVLFTQWKWKWNLVATLFGAGFISLMLYMI